VNSNDPIVRRRLNQYRRQLEVYAHIVEERTGYKVSKMHLYYPKEEEGNPQVTFPANAHNISATIQSFDEVVRKIETKNFDMSNVSKSEKLCGECDMRYMCNPRHYSK
jgi:DNA helicase-2/ATP-dependent DNA helicase PcrA